jgi:DUF4097 and DUF4098 domain-containing protein YvlB
MNRWWLIVPLLAAQAAAQPTVKREGGAWVAREQGVATAKPVLKISAPGRIRVTAAKDGRVTYSWAAKLRASSEAEARTIGLRNAMQLKQGADFCVLVAPGAGELAPGELQVEVPARITRLFLQSGNGSLHLDGVQAEVQAVTAAGAIEMDGVRGNIVARTGGGTMTFGVVEGAVRALSGGGTIRVGRIAAEAVLETAGGEIYVGEVGGTLRLSTAGNIYVGKAGRMVSAHTSGGMIEVESAGGLVTAESMGGGITVGTAPGVRCESANGSIRLRNVTGTVRASTASGNLYVGLAGDRLGEDSFLATGRGDITVFFPSNLAVTVKALNESGGWPSRFSSEFPELQAPVAEVAPGRPLAVHGNLNGGGPLLMLSTGGGAIQLKRRK